jgi:hypothetical protein
MTDRSLCRQDRKNRVGDAFASLHHRNLANPFYSIQLFTPVFLLSLFAPLFVLLVSLFRHSTSFVALLSMSAAAVADMSRSSLSCSRCTFVNVAGATSSQEPLSLRTAHPEPDPSQRLKQFMVCVMPVVLRRVASRSSQVLSPAAALRFVIVNAIIVADFVAAAAAAR